MTKFCVLSIFYLKLIRHINKIIVVPKSTNGNSIKVTINGLDVSYVHTDKKDIMSKIITRKNSPLTKLLIII